jgi:hypothetical protein
LPNREEVETLAHKHHTFGVGTVGVGDAPVRGTHIMDTTACLGPIQITIYQDIPRNPAYHIRGGLEKTNKQNKINTGALYKQTRKTNPNSATD